MKKSFLIVCILGVLLSSCTTYFGYKNESPDYIPIKHQNVKVVDVVKIEMECTGILGLTPEFSLLSFGKSSSYVALLEKAKELGADDVLNLKQDIEYTCYTIFYNKRKWIASGLAVKYVK